jgi:hypothetical protein
MEPGYPIEPGEDKDVFYPEEAARIHDAFDRVFGDDGKLLFLGVRYERDRADPSEEEAVIFGRSRHRLHPD